MDFDNKRTVYGLAATNTQPLTPIADNVSRKRTAAHYGCKYQRV